jgi:asparagine synthetase B (glutamine-hydrolysing)
MVTSENGKFKVETIPYTQQSMASIPFEPPTALLTELDHDPLFEHLSTTFLSQLQAAVTRRVSNLPSLCRQCKRLTDSMLRPMHGCEHAKLAILFSGGIDSTVLTVLADRILPVHEPIDLLNVAFFSEVSAPPADRQTGTHRKERYRMLRK